MNRKESIGLAVTLGGLIVALAAVLHKLAAHFFNLSPRYMATEICFAFVLSFAVIIGALGLATKYIFKAK